MTKQPRRSKRNISDRSVAQLQEVVEKTNGKARKKRKTAVNINDDEDDDKFQVAPPANKRDDELGRGNRRKKNTEKGASFVASLTKKNVTSSTKKNVTSSTKKNAASSTKKKTRSVLIPTSQNRRIEFTLPRGELGLTPKSSQSRRRMTPAELENIPPFPSSSIDHLTPNKGGRHKHTNTQGKKLNFENAVDESIDSKKRKESPSATKSSTNEKQHGSASKPSAEAAAEAPLQLQQQAEATKAATAAALLAKEQQEAALQLQQQQAESAKTATVAALLTKEQQEAAAALQLQQQQADAATEKARKATMVAEAVLLLAKEQQEAVVALKLQQQQAASATTAKAAALLAKEKQEAAVALQRQQQQEAGATRTSSLSVTNAIVVGSNERQRRLVSELSTGNDWGHEKLPSGGGEKDVNEEESKLKSSLAETGGSKNDAESESAIKVTKVKRSNENDTNRISKSIHSFVLPNVANEIEVHFLQSINNNIAHDAIKFDRDMSTKLVTFPFNDVIVNRDDLHVLSRDPHKIVNKDNPYRLYAGADICDLCTWWTGDSSRSVIVLPACSYTYMKKLDKTDYSQDCDIERYLRNKLTINTTDLVNKDVVIVPIFAENHYSFSVMFYPFKAADGSGKYVNHHPCIVCANSLPEHGRLHKREVIDKVLRRWLNKFNKYHFPKLYGNCNKRTYPSHTISVPKQPDGWSCLYQVLHMIHCTKQFVKNNSYGFTDTVADDLDKFSNDYFSYNPADGGTTLRDSLSYVCRCLLHIQRSRNGVCKNKDGCEDDGRIMLVHKDFDLLKTSPIEIMDDINDEDDGLNYFDEWKPVAPIQLTVKALSKLIPVKKELISDQKNEARVATLLKRKDVVDTRRRFIGRANRRDNPDTAKEVKKGRKKKSHNRINGQYACDLDGYKDDPFRKMLFRFMRTLKHVRQMSLFKKEKTNKKCLRMRTITIIVDPISEYPHLKGDDFDQERDRPLRLLIADNIETVDLLLREVQMHRDEFHLVNDEYKVDEMIFGTRRPPIETLFGRKKQYEAQDDPVETALLAEENQEVSSTPRPTKDQSSSVPPCTGAQIMS